MTTFESFQPENAYFSHDTLRKKKRFQKKKTNQKTCEIEISNRRESKMEVILEWKLGAIQRYMFSQVQILRNVENFGQFKKLIHTKCFF